MLERVAVASSSVPDPPVLRPSATPHPAALLGPQRTVSNAAIQRLALGLARHDESAAVIALQRAVATRRTLAREGDDPGPPELPDPKGFTCGIKDGKPFCTVATGKGDSLEVDPSALKPESPSATDPKRPKSCPPERWNWYWETCCPTAKHFDPATKSCKPDAKQREQPFDIPPAPPQPKGDFPLPDESQAYA